MSSDQKNELEPLKTKISAKKIDLNVSPTKFSAGGNDSPGTGKGY